jgi:hypothetical protein
VSVRALPVPARLSFAFAPPTLEDAAELLRTGRAQEALSVLYRLPSRIQEERREAVADAVAAHRAALAEANRRVTELQREVERLTRELARPLHQNPRQLAAALAAGRITPERVAEVLKIRVSDVARLAEGRVQLSAGQWQRLLTEIAA